MKKTAFIFPGQGSQIVGMGRDIYENYEEAKKVYDTADNALGYKISEICFNGPEEVLKQTKNTQPAILTTSLACLAALQKETDLQPAAVAGHSLGEYGALYTAGVLNLEDAIKITGIRASLMDEAANQTNGSMAAVIGLSEDVIKETLTELSKDGKISVANYNCPGQIVITGEKHLIEKSVDILKEKGAKRVLELAVSGAFHSELMKGAAEKFAEKIKTYDFKNGKIAVYENTDAKSVTNGSDLKDRVVKQIYSSVCWTATIQNMLKDGIEQFIEIGTGKVLAGLNKKIDANIKTYNIYDSESLRAVINELKGE
ncbi:MAG: ACP S-malonyltransferase [Candidatus Gastranaerophilales bacterium]|nr:ACP S-malonyltransferase [Candidatus Gastranaerophilales bacterium]